MQHRIVYLDDSGQGVVVCLSCGEKIKVKTEIDTFPTNPLKITCRCNSCLEIVLERRKHFRKSLRVTGLYFQENASGKDMLVENISMTGVGFKTVLQNKLQPGDVVRVQFRLDDAERSLLDRTAVVRAVKERYVGAEFCDNRWDKVLGFYLR